MTSAALDDVLSPRSHHLPAAALAVVVTAVVTGLAVAAGDTGRLVAVALLQLALVAAWVLATGIRGLRGSLALGVAAAAGADLAVVLPARPQLDALLAVLGLGFLAAVVHQMARSAPRTYLVASLAGVTLLLSCVCGLAALLAVGRLDGGPRALGTAVLAVGAALLVGSLTDAVLPRPRVADGVPRGVPGVVLAVLAGALVAVLRREDADPGGILAAVGTGAALGCVAAMCAVAASFVAAERALAERALAERAPAVRAGWAMPVLQVVLPLAAAAPVAYAVALRGGW